MSDDPYFKAQDDARSGRSLSPGADESTYWAERQNVEAERSRREAEQSAQHAASSSSADLIDSWLPAAPESHALSPEEARAGLIGCAVMPVAVALAPVYFALYPLVTIAAVTAGYLTWRAVGSGGGSVFIGLLVVAVFIIATWVTSRAEHALARSRVYRLVRLPLRALGLSILFLNLLTAAGIGLACRPPVDPDRLDQLAPLLGAYYKCLLAQPMVIGMVLGAIALIVVAGRSSALRERWHRGLRALRLHG
ncbi:MAG: hypothetical protein IPG61_16755 [bacterium]|nr:hypothetical protein [bacterium]